MDEEAVEKDDLIISRFVMIMRVTTILENVWWEYIRIKISIIRINSVIIDQFSVWKLLLSKYIGVFPLGSQLFFSKYYYVLSFGI